MLRPGAWPSLTVFGRPNVPAGMMKMKLKKLLVSASAVACLVWPAAVLADPPSDQGGKPDEQGQQHRDKSATHGGGAAAPAARTLQDRGAGGQPKAHVGPTGPAVAPTTPTVRTLQDRGGGQPKAHVGPTGPTGPAAGPTLRSTPQTHRAPTGPVNPRPDMTVHRPPATVQTGPAPSVQVGPVRRPGGKAARPPAGVPRLGDWNRTVRGPDRDQAGQQWRHGHSNWDSRSPWRQNPNWWRRDRSFRLFLGPRIGFFFIPDFGYVRAPQQYERHYWRTGEFLPNWFWRYEVRAYWRYNLPQPPDGCMWVWVDNDIALIDASDGYILDIVHNAW
jgi:Ni/Co efflux regulator RcnB